MKRIACCRILVVCLAAGFWLAAERCPGAQEGADPGQKPIAGFADLVQMLKDGNVSHKVDAKTKSVALGVRSGDLEGVMLIIWRDNDGLVQFVQTMPFEIPADRMQAMEGAVTRANHAVSFAGFGLDHKQRKMYFRMSVPYQPRGALQAREVQAYLTGTLQQAATFYLPFRRVALEGASPEGVVEDARKEVAKRKQG
jgi:hypothetical protein